MVSLYLAARRSIPRLTLRSPDLSISAVCPSIWLLFSSLTPLPRSSGTNVTPDNMTLIRFYGKTYDAGPIMARFGHSLIRSAAVVAVCISDPNYTHRTRGYRSQSSGIDWH